MIYIYCDRPSNSARTLAIGLGARRLGMKKGQTYKLDIPIINWGCTELYSPRSKIINPPERVRMATDKLQFFQAMEPLGLTPPFYTTSVEASKAIEKGKQIVCRTILNGHSGIGIIVASSVDHVVPAKLYVEYIKKETEWRVHVLNEKVIDIQRKARDKNVPDDKVDWTIRNHHNGFVYIRGDITHYPDSFVSILQTMAINTVKQIGLDFGAVDLVATKSGKVYVLEVNTAPGLEGTTLTNYINGFKEYLK